MIIIIMIIMLMIIATILLLLLLLIISIAVIPQTSCSQPLISSDLLGLVDDDGQDEVREAELDLWPIRCVYIYIHICICVCIFLSLSKYKYIYIYHNIINNIIHVYA